MLMKYAGGIYNGSVRNVKSKSNQKGRKRAAKHRFIPHGWGQLEFKNDVRYIGYFRNGFEHGRGTLIWENGDRYDCFFKHGRPEASSLRFVHARAKTQIAELNSSLINCQEDLSLEKDTSMQLALSLDRAQDRCQALYTLAQTAGANIDELNAIRYGDGF